MDIYILSAANNFTVEQIQEGITLLVAGAGVVVTVINVAMSMWARANSSAIEISLMTKGEQYKYKASNIMVVISVFAILFVIVGGIKLWINITQGADNSNVLSVSYEVEVIEKETQIAGQEYEETKQIDYMSSLLILIGVFGSFIIAVALMFFYGLRWCKKIIVQIRDWYARKKNVLIKWGIVCGGLFFLGIVISQLFDSNWIWILYCIGGGIYVVVYVVRKKLEDILIEKMKFALYMSLYLGLFGINNLFIWNVMDYEGVISVADMAMKSVLLALILGLYTYLVVVFPFNPGQAKVLYYDKELNREIYLYFRYNEVFFVAGESEKMEDSQAFFLMKVDDVIRERIQRVNGKIGDYSKLYSANIKLQLEGQPEVLIEDVRKKLVDILVEHKVSRDEYSKMPIYIKHKERMVYFVLEDEEKIPREEQKFSI